MARMGRDLANSFLYNETQNFEICTQKANFFQNEIENFEPKWPIRISHKEIRNVTIYNQFSFVS